MTTHPTARPQPAAHRRPIPRDLGTPIYDRLEAEYATRRRTIPTSRAAAHAETASDGTIHSNDDRLRTLLTTLASAEHEPEQEPATTEFPGRTVNPWFTTSSEAAV